MTSRTVARRYAKGLLEAAATAAPGHEQELREQLAALVEVIASHEGLQLLVMNPVIRGSQKRAILTDIGSRLGLHQVLTRFIEIVAEKERLDHLEVISTVYAELVDEHLGIVTAEVTTPTALNPGQRADLEASLRAATGGEVRLSARTDEALLGGIVTRIGDMVYDGSLRGHLARIRERLESS